MQARYEDIKKCALGYIKVIGYKPEMVPVLPVCGGPGDNIFVLSLNITGLNPPGVIKEYEKEYSGQTFVDALEYIANNDFPDVAKDDISKDDVSKGKLVARNSLVPPDLKRIRLV